MSLSPSLPWEIIEMVVDHSADSTETLYSFTLTCRDLRNRSTFCLLRCVTGRLKSRHQLLALCAFLQTKPHLLPCVRSITVPAHEFSPDPLLRILPNLSNINFTSPDGSRLQKHYHVFVLNYCRRLGQHIQTLSLQNLYFYSLSAFSDILLLLPRIESLSCEGLRVGKSRVNKELIRVITQRLSKRLHLRTLTIGGGNDNIVLAFLREAAKHKLVTLTLVHEGVVGKYGNECFEEIVLASPSDWVQLTSLIWNSGAPKDSINFQLESAISVLREGWHPPKLREVTVGIGIDSIPPLLPSSDRPPSLELCAELEKALLKFPQPTISFSLLQLLNNRQYHSWMPTVEGLFPALAEHRALRISAEYSGMAGHDGMMSTPIVTSADSRWAATASSEDRTIIIWDLQSGCISQEWFAEETELESLAFSPDSQYVMSTGKRTTSTSTKREQRHRCQVTVWDLHQDGRRVGSLHGEGDNDRGHPLLWETRNCAWSPDGTCIAAGVPEDGATHIWETTTFQHLHALEGSELLAFSTDGHWVVTADLEEHLHSPGLTRCPTARIWNIELGTLHRLLQGHINSVRAAAFDPENTRVVTGSDDSTIRIWDVESGEQLFILEEQAKRWVGAMAFSGDGRMVLSHSCVWRDQDDSSGGVKVWDASNGVLLASLSGTRADMGHCTPHSACFSPCGSYVASAAKGKVVLLWRTSDWSCIAEVSGGGARVTHVAISPDGRVLCWGTEAGTVFFRRMHDLVAANGD